MRAISLATTGLGILLALPGAAEPAAPAMTAEDLQQLCAGSDHVSRNACRIYILGVTQGITLGMKLAAEGRKGARPCVPPSVSAATLEERLTARLDEDLAASPVNRPREAAEFIGALLTATYPCTRPGP